MIKIVFSGSMFRNLDLSMLGPRIELPNLAPPTPPSPVAPAGKGVQVNLENKELWTKFHALNTEMIITKTGRFVRFDTDFVISVVFCRNQNLFKKFS